LLASDVSPDFLIYHFSAVRAFIFDTFTGSFHIHLQSGNLYAGNSTDGTEDSSVNALSP